MGKFFDFNDAPQQSGDLIPAKTFAKVCVTIKPGGKGDGGWITQSNSGFEYLALELTIMSTPMAKRKIFQNAGVGGTTEGHNKAAEITRSFLRGMLESANGIEPKDESDKARRARCITSWADLDELIFAVEIGIDKGKDGYEDKNKITRAITPDHKFYQRVMNGETILPGTNNKNISSTPAPNTSVPTTTAVPEWAR